MKPATTLIVNRFLRLLTVSRVMSKHLPTAVCACTIAFAGNLAQPKTAQAQPWCLLCYETMAYEDGEWYWTHFFNVLSEEVCANDPGPMCRMCGKTSTCHTGAPIDEDGDGEPDRRDIDRGRCHSVGCMPEFALLDLAREVTTLSANLDSQSGPVLAGRIASEPNLVYDAAQNMVRLMRCEGSVMREWYLDESIRTYLIPYFRVLGPQGGDYRVLS